MRAALLDLDAHLRWVDVMQYRELIDPQIRSWRLGATMFTTFGLLALLVAAIGLYSVLGFDVAQRTREIGLRTVLGADTRRILAMVAARAIVLAGVGTMVGVIFAVLLAPQLDELLYETSPHDPLVLASSPPSRSSPVTSTA
jgi:ABC-type antimicrobial peptide transport system permease subunit